MLVGVENDQALKREDPIRVVLLVITTSIASFTSILTASTF